VVQLPQEEEEMMLTRSRKNTCKPKLTINVPTDDGDGDNEGGDAFKTRTTRSITLVNRNQPMSTKSAHSGTIRLHRNDTISESGLSVNEKSVSDVGVEGKDTPERRPQKSPQEKETIKFKLKTLTLEDEEDSSPMFGGSKSVSCDYELRRPTPSQPVKKNTGGFSSIRVRRSINETPINIDTDDINKMYKYGGEGKDNNSEEEAKQLEFRIRQLAKHCVDYMNGVDTDCEIFKLSEITSNLKIVEQVQQPKSVKGPNKKISFKLSDIDDIIEEENEMSSPFKKSARRSTKEGDMDKIMLETVKQKLIFEQETTEEAGNTSNFPLVNQRSTEFEEMISSRANTYPTPLYSQKELEQIEKHFNKEKYNSYLDVLYTNLFDWLLNKKKLNRYTINSNIFIDDTDVIQNSQVIDIIIRLSYNTDNIYIQKLMQDLLLLVNNRENSLILYKNNNFYSWLIDTAFKFYKLKSDEVEVNIALSVYELSNKIHTELLLGNVTEKNELLTSKLDYLLSWGIQQKNINTTLDGNQMRKVGLEINEFIKNLLKDLLNNFKNRISNCSPSINYTPLENFLCFVIIAYEYMTFYNLESSLRLNSLSFSEMGSENIIVPRCIFSGLNLDHNMSEENNSNALRISHLWTDYKMFDGMYSFFSKLWGKDLFKFPSNALNVIQKYDPIVEDYIKNKKKRDIFLEDMKILNYRIAGRDIPLIKVFSALFTINISLLQDDVEIRHWISEYERFLIFVIIASCNITSTHVDYSTIQESVAEVVAFSLCFLLDEYFNSRKNTTFIKYYIQTIKNIFGLITVILDYSYQQTSKKKKNINIFSSLIKKSKKHDLTKSGIYKIFIEWVVDSNGTPVLNSKVVEEIKKNKLIDIPELFRNTEWRNGLTESNLLKEKLKKVFDFVEYNRVLRERREKKLESFKFNTEVIKGAVIKSVEAIVPTYEIEMKEYNNQIFHSNKQRRVIYKCLKKKLFTWKGMWSDRELFYYNLDKMKLKVLNHYTSFLSRPILIPILDLDHYLPKFSRFDKSLLFNKNDKNANYRVNLDIEDILRPGSDSLSTKPSNMEVLSAIRKKDEFTIHNFLYDIFKLNNPTIWKGYTEINSTLDFKEYNYHNIVPLNQNYTVKQFYLCCFVKPSHHIKGLFYLNKEGITFKVFIQNKLTLSDSMARLHRTNSISIVEKKDEDYDPDRNTCYGSYFVSHHKDSDHISHNYPYNEIRYIFKRRYYYKKSGMEIFTTTNKSYYFNFKSQADRDNILKGILHQIEFKREIKLDQKENVKDKEELVIGYECFPGAKKLNLKSEYLSNKIESWSNWKISNFEMIMWLNLCANRSFSDLSQYPVFPWILKNYTEKEIKLDQDLREFDLPMGMMEIDDKGKGKERKLLYLEAYRSLQSEISSGLSTEIPYLYGSHYSNPMYVAHYLTRIFPFSHIMIELQGDKFDDPNRLFISIANSFFCATTQKGDVRELTPEFFYLPEMFQNINNLNLGIRTDSNLNKVVVNNVELPEWCNNDSCEFIIKMKDYLESDNVSVALNEWVDLIFGFKQKGKEGENSLNLFIPSSYEDNVNIETMEEDQIGYYMRMVEFGLTPTQLLMRPFAGRYNREYVRKGRLITESHELRAYGNLVPSNKKNKNVMIKMKVLENDRVMCVYNNNIFNICKFTPGDYKYNIDIYTSKSFNNFENIFKINNKISDYYHNPEVNSPVLIYNNGRIIAQAGYWDGSICLCFYEGNHNKVFYHFTDYSPIVVLVMDKTERYAYAGNKLGVLYVFEVNEFSWNLSSTIYDHNKEITFISVSNSLNVVATSSLDGYVNLYTFPGNRLFRSVYLIGDIDITADYVSININTFRYSYQVRHWLVLSFIVRQRMSSTAITSTEV
jgi:hypothetical protein